MSDTAPPSGDYLCPHCGHSIAAEQVPALLAQAKPDELFGQPEIICPHCGQQFVLGDLGDEAAAQEEADEAARKQLEDELREEELSAARIHNLARGRKAIIRQRSFYFGFAVMAGVIAADLIWYGVKPAVMLGQFSWRQAGFCLFAGAALVLGSYCLRRARELRHELDATRQPDPETPPDFTGLTSSEPWKDLHNIK